MQNKKVLLSWLITGIILVVFSIGTLIHAFTNSICRIGPAVCGGERIGAYIGISLGIIAIIMAFYYPHKDNRPQKAPQNNNRHHGLVIFGPSLIVTAMIMAVIGLNSKNLNPSGSAMTPGAAMAISAAPIALVGIIITSFGIYNLSRQQKSKKTTPPITISIFIIGIIAMIFFIFF